jgi:hypothetical protein
MSAGFVVSGHLVTKKVSALWVPEHFTGFFRAYGASISATVCRKHCPAFGFTVYAAFAGEASVAMTRVEISAVIRKRFKVSPSINCYLSLACSH